MKKVLKIWQNNFGRNFIILFGSFMILELEFRLISMLNLLEYSFLRVSLGVAIIAFIIAFIEKKLPNIVAKIINSFLIFIASIYGIAELGFKNFLGVFASVSTSSQVGAVLSYTKDFIMSFKWFYYLLLIPFIIVFIYYVFIDKKIVLDMPKKKKGKKNILYFFIYLFVLSSLILTYIGTLEFSFMQNKTQVETSLELFKKPDNPSLAINDFGYISFALLDIKEYFFPGEDQNINVSYDPNLIPNTDLEVEHKEYIPHLTVDNDFWKDLIDNETNKNYNALNKYFISKDSTMTNDYTGLFEGKNLIIIMAESGSNLMLNEELYPNISKLYNEGWSWKNYYSPRNTCSTGNNEMSGMISLYSIYNNCTANVYRKNTYFESIFNLFNQKGYNTSSYHNNFDEYYYRTTIHKNMGSKKFYKVQDMDIYYGTTYGDWASDVDLMNFYLKSLDEREEGPFMSWITTVTAHQPYSNSSTYNDKYLDLMPSEYAKDVRRYMSKLKTVDEAIGVLLEGLEERDILDDTVIVLYADHYPYALSNKNLSEAYGYEINIDNNADQVPFIIYNSELTNKIYDDYTSYIDITPTIANLFNLDYDSRLYMGHDILSDDIDDMVIFADGSWKNAIGFYSTTTNTINYYTSKVYSDEELLGINELVSLKLDMSSLAIKNNYFEYLKKKMDNYKATSE